MRHGAWQPTRAMARVAERQERREHVERWCPGAEYLVGPEALQGRGRWRASGRIGAPTRSHRLLRRTPVRVHAALAAPAATSY